MDVLTLAKTLIEKPSLTPDDAGCQALIAARLTAVGFQCTALPNKGVDNLWAVHGDAGPLFVFAGHTDVVPAGEGWETDPFQTVEKEGLLYGRGTADMKGALAAMVIAAEQFVTEHPDHTGRIAFLITSDEEGDAIDGTQHVMQWLAEQDEQIDYCIVGEASSDKKLGDRLRHGRRGSLHADITLIGKQGHVAYPERAKNPLHESFKALDALCDTVWDNGNEYFPATTLQIANLHAGTGARNVIPGKATVQLNFRFNDTQTPNDLKMRTEGILNAHGVDFKADWQLSASPFVTPPGKLTETISQVIEDQLGYRPRLSTGGGTSDARFVAPTGAEVVELGVLAETIHHANECVSIADLEQLVGVYRGIASAFAGLRAKR